MAHCEVWSPEPLVLDQRGMHEDKEICSSPFTSNTRLCTALMYWVMTNWSAAEFRRELWWVNSWWGRQTMLISGESENW